MDDIAGGSEEPQVETVAEVEFNEHKKVKIVDQVWMAKNLGVTQLKEPTNTNHDA